MRESVKPGVIILIMILLLLFSAPAFSDELAEESDYPAAAQAKFLTGEEPLPDSKENQKNSLGISGDGNTPGALVAYTWYEYQQNSTMGRLIDWRMPNPQIHMGYTQISENGGPRSLSYNIYNPVDGTWPLGSGTGCKVTDVATGYAGFANTDVTPLGAAVIAGHARLAPPYHTAVFIDALAPHGSYCGFIDSSIVAGVTGTIEGGDMIWPKLEYHIYGSDTSIYAFSCESTAGTLSSLMLFMNPSSDLSGSWSVYVIDTVEFMCQDITASRVSPRVACCWLEKPAGGVSNSSDVWYLISDDMGVTWNPANKVNVTDYMTNGGNYQGWIELSCLFDTEDHLHIVWNAHYFNGSTTVYRQCKLYHWAEHTGLISTIHDATWDPTVLCGYGGLNNLNVAKFSISECNGKLYALWIQWGNPAVGDVSDCFSWVSDNTYAYNGDIYLSVSPDLNGSFWDAARNITNTKSPGCSDAEGNECDNENWLSVSRYGMNNDAPEFYQLTWDQNALTVDPSVPPNSPYSGSYYLDVMYVNDLLPGAYPSNEGLPTNSPIKWFRLPCVEPELADVDQDGVFDVIDNCMYQYNPGQEDSDNDGIGDACCCAGIRGDADCSGDYDPDISDITRLIDYLYISHEVLCCPNEADADASGGEPDISDITRLIDYLYISHDPMDNCP